MTNFEYVQATDFDRAWFNFEPDLPLDPGPHGEINPFYIERSPDRTARLERELVRVYKQTPKYFFSGQRGCGKSTELKKLSVNPKVLEKYWSIYFTIRDEASSNDLDYKDVLLAICGQMFRQYHKMGGELPKNLLKDMNLWCASIQKQVRSTITEKDSQGAKADLLSFFTNVGNKMKLELTTRQELRQVLERNVSDLISTINHMASATVEHAQCSPLLMIDDLDKTNNNQSRIIFIDHLETMLQLDVPVVYTVPHTLLHLSEFQVDRDRPILLSNLPLHEPGQPDNQNAINYASMARFVWKRMQPELINTSALESAITLSGGSFREMARLMRIALDYASSSNRYHVHVEDIEKAGSEICGEYQRFLTQEELEALKTVHERNSLDTFEKDASLLQNLAILEYGDASPWYDVHPALLRLFDSRGESPPDDNAYG